MVSPYFSGSLDKIFPVVDQSGSDSAMLDNTLEFLVMNGMDLPLAVTCVIPEPWENHDTLSQKKRDFYQYYATMMEPWDGPASVLFSDGDILGAVLDRERSASVQVLHHPGRLSLSVIRSGSTSGNPGRTDPGKRKDSSGKDAGGGYCETKNSDR